ncbi:hypothetical protein [Tenacibaculum maritimum]|uniref:hypothetical protein n=1 Tax=Tenacibaculum maritimum TaxID=107401 RepID=UPI0012E681A2|nr:hypothetical protein [Tenacibaculum maritimum]CAA0212023.1 hypothetical protein CVI1001048_30064 [Tenacibaculum maritimum]
MKNVKEVVNANLEPVILVFLVSAGSLSSNTVNMVSYTRKNAFAVRVTGPRKGEVNEECIFNVKFELADNESLFSKFVEEGSNKLRTIEVEVKYSDINRNTATKMRIEEYRFKVKERGDYELKFKKSATEYITKRITII